MGSDCFSLLRESVSTLSDGFVFSPCLLFGLRNDLHYLRFSNVFLEASPLALLPRVS